MAASCCCVVCHEPCKEGRLLPCLHTACYFCIKDIETEATEKHHPPSCVVCREVFLPDKLVPLMETKNTSVCLVHPNEELVLFCDVCKKFACNVCIATAAHESHLMLKFADAAARFQKVLETRAIKLKANLPTLQTFLAEQGALKCALDNRLIALRQQIISSFDPLITEVNKNHVVENGFSNLTVSEDSLSEISTKYQAVAGRRDYLISLAYSMIQEDLKVLMLHRENLELLHELILMALEHAQALTSTVNQTVPSVEFLRLHVVVAARLRTLYDNQLAVVSSGLSVKDTLRFSFPKFIQPQVSIDSLGKIGRFRDYRDLSQPQLVFGSQGSDPAQFNCPAGLATFSDGHLLVADSGNSRIQVVTASGEHVHTIPIIGSSRYAAVTAEGNLWVPVFDYDLVILYARDGSILRELVYSQPIAVVCFPDTGEIVLSSGSGAIAAFSADCHQLWSASRQRVGATYSSLAVIPSTREILLCEPKRNCVVVFSSVTGEVVRSIGMNQLQGPSGLCVTADEHVIITETKAHAVSVWTADGEFVHRWGCKGTEPKHFWAPEGVVQLPDGRIAVADTQNYCIKIFNT